jgi:hypothetical protein
MVVYLVARPRRPRHKRLSRRGTSSGARCDGDHGRCVLSKLMMFHKGHASKYAVGLLGLSSALGCFSATLDQDELDAKAAGASTASGTQAEAALQADAGAGFTVALDTPPIELDFDGEATRDPCVATTRQATTILRQHCAGCHAPPAGMGGFRSILDFPTLVTLTSNTQRDPATNEPVRLLIPGDPESSRVYRRVAGGEMPPSRDASLPQLPSPTTSDVSILREWIASCLPGIEPLAQPSGLASADAGAP